MDKLDRIGQALLEYETIDGTELLALIRGEPLSRSKPAQRVKSREELLAEKAEKQKEASVTSADTAFAVDPEAAELKKA
jgi:hypothetical protein